MINRKTVDVKQSFYETQPTFERQPMRIKDWLAREDLIPRLPFKSRLLLPASSFHVVFNLTWSLLVSPEHNLIRPCRLDFSSSRYREGCNLFWAGLQRRFAAYASQPFGCFCYSEITPQPLFEVASGIHSVLSDDTSQLDNPVRRAVLKLLLVTPTA